MKLDIIVPTHNSSSTLLSCVGSLLRNHSLQAVTYKIIVSDDGSDPAHIQHLESALPANVCLVQAEFNTGAAGARNRGANAGNGDFILLIDDDCELDPHSDIKSALRMGASGLEILLGNLRASGSDFFAKYFNHVQARRLRQYQNSSFNDGTTAIAMISRPSFQRLGGFDAGYRSYGFEDRDFIQRAHDQRVKVGFCSALLANHQMKPSIKLLADKMYCAGRHTSARFAQRHPVAYSKSAYAQLDPRLNHWARWPARAYRSPAYISCLSILERSVRLRLAPGAILRALARFVQGVAYAAGCQDAASARPPCGGPQKGGRFHSGESDSASYRQG